jgi:putative membrane protein
LNPHAIERPDEKLMQYYLLKALASGPAILVTLPVLYFRYHTMRYRFDDEGISMRWGILFRHEIVLNYSRIQDVHLQSNAVERWLGLARIELQTASGGANPEMTIEGIPEFEALRDFLYSKMRGAREHPAATAAPGSEDEHSLPGALLSIAAELRGIREILERRGV